MSGWVPMPAEVWALAAPHLPLPWAEEAARFDLRWHVDQTGRLPSRSQLAARWGWTRDEVRTELRHPERWWDRMKGPLPSSRDDLTQRDPRRPRLTQPDPDGTDEPDESSDSDPVRPSLTQPDPAVPQRVGSPSPSPSRATVPQTPAERGQEPDPTDPAAAELVYQLLLGAVPDPDPDVYADQQEATERTAAARAVLWSRAAKGERQLAEDVLVAERGRLELYGIRRWPKVAALLVRLAQERAPP